MEVKDLKEGLVVTIPPGMGKINREFKIVSWTSVNDKIAEVNLISLDGSETTVMRNVYLTKA